MISGSILSVSCERFDDREYTVLTVVLDLARALRAGSGAPALEAVAKTAKENKIVLGRPLAASPSRPEMIARGAQVVRIATEHGESVFDVLRTNLIETSAGHALLRVYVDKTSRNDLAPLVGPTAQVTDKLDSREVMSTRSPRSIV